MFVFNTLSLYIICLLMARTDMVLFECKSNRFEPFIAGSSIGFVSIKLPVLFDSRLFGARDRVPQLAQQPIFA